MVGRDKRKTSGIRSQIWFMPMVAILGTTLLALLTTALDRRLAGTGVFQDLFTRFEELDLETSDAGSIRRVELRARLQTAYLRPGNGAAVDLIGSVGDL